MHRKPGVRRAEPGNLRFFRDPREGSFNPREGSFNIRTRRVVE
jgi:hypothetical protein